MAIDEANQTQGIEYPNASLAAAGAAVVPDALDIFALRAPMFADASHHANVGGLIRFCSDATQRQEVIAGRHWLPRIEGVGSLRYAPDEAVTCRAREVSIEDKRHPAAPSHPAPSRVRKLQSQSRNAIPIGVVESVTRVMAQIHISSVTLESGFMIDRFPHAAFHTTHTSLAFPDLGELSNYLHLDFNSCKDGAGMASLC